MIEWQPFGQKSVDFLQNPVHLDARINILEGSVRSSKTVTLIPKFLCYLKDGPPGLIVITGVSKDTIFDNVLNDLFDTVGKSHYMYNQSSGIITMYDRQIKVIGAKDEGSEKYIRGKTIAGAFCDEVSLMPERFFKQLLNRMSVKGAKLYATTNPDTPLHYLYTEFITNETKLKSGMVKDIHFTLDDNPNLDEEYIEFIKNAYTGLWYKRMILGMWVVAEGAIYDMVDDDLNYYDQMPDGLKARCNRTIAIDYGTTNPMVFGDFYDDGTTLWLDDLYYYNSKIEGKQKTDSQYADDLEKFIAAEYPNFIIVDPSAASFKAELQQRGYRVKDADNEVNDGLRMTATMLGRRLLKINKSKCKKFKEEQQGYVWDEKAAKKGEEKPLKENDHVMDMVRYQVKTLIHPSRLIA
jgi:PBSX family phage terminase large subunit